MKVYKQTGRFEIDQEEKEKTIRATVVRTRYTLYTVHTVHGKHCTLYTLYTVHTVHGTHCTRYTLYTVHTVQVVLTQPPFTFPY